MDNQIKKVRIKIPATLYPGRIKRRKTWFRNRGLYCRGSSSAERIIPLSFDELRKRRIIISINKKFNPAPTLHYGYWRMEIVQNNMRSICPYQIDVTRPLQELFGGGHVLNLNGAPQPDHCQEYWYYYKNVLGFRKEADLSYYLLKNGHLLA